MSNVPPQSIREPVGQRVAHILDQGLQNVGIAIVGDSYSTGTNPDRWGARLAKYLAWKYPAYTVTYAEFNAGYTAMTGLQAGTGTAVQSGTGQLNMTANSPVTAGGNVQLRPDGQIEPQTTGRLLGTSVSTVASGNTKVNFAAPLLVIYDAALSGTGWDYPLGRGYQMVGQYAPDLIFIMEGANENQLVGADFLSRTVQAVENVCSWSPDSEIVLMSQNDLIAPATNAGSFQTQRRAVLHDIAQRRGFGFLDINEVLRKAGLTTFIQSIDGVHPTNDQPGNPSAGQFGADGQDLILREVLAGMAIKRGTLRGAKQRPPALLQRAGRPIYYQDFQSASWDGTPASFAAVFGGTLANVTTAKDVTNFEPPAAQSVALSVTASGAGTATWTKDLQTAGLTALAGRWVTLAIRVFIPSGQNAAVCRMRLASDNSLNYNQTQWLSAASAFTGQIYTVLVHHQVQPVPDRLRVILYVDSSGTGNSAPAPSFSLLRMCAVFGRDPRDYA